MFRLLLLLLLVIGSNSFLHNHCKRFGRRFSSSTLHASDSSKSRDLNPSSFSGDLYRILGVSRNATKSELRDNYWSIASKNHPDRNNTQAALEIFRNASYAYKILKDPKKKQEYDNSKETKLFLDVIKEVGSEIVVPLAMDVAVPIINLTFHSVRSFAFPYIRDAFEQSSAILNAAVGDTHDKGTDSIDYVTQTAQKVVRAREDVSAKQLVRRLKDRIEKTQSEILKNTKRLESARAKENETITMKLQQENISSALQNKLNSAQRAVAQFTKAYVDMRDEEITASSEYKTKSIRLNSLLNKSEELTFSLQRERAEVERLKALLTAAEGRVTVLSSELDITTVEILPEKKRALELLDKYKLKMTTRDILYNKLKNSEKSRSEIKIESDNITTTLTEIKEKVLRQQEYVMILDKRLKELQSLLISLQQKSIEAETALSKRELEHSKVVALTNAAEELINNSIKKTRKTAYVDLIEDSDEDILTKE